MCDDSHTPGTQTELLSQGWPGAGDNTCTEAREQAQSCGETEALGARQALWASAAVAAPCPTFPSVYSGAGHPSAEGKSWHLQGDGPQKLREI